MLFLTLVILCGARIGSRFALAKFLSVSNMFRSASNTYHSSCKSSKDFFLKSLANHSLPMCALSSPRAASMNASSPCARDVDAVEDTPRIHVDDDG